MADESPFDFGSTVSREAFTDRRQELDRLKTNLSSGINTVLISPRRWGKSSLVEQAVIELRRQRKDVRVAVLDLFTAGSFEEFLESYASAILQASSGKWEERVRDAKTFFRAIVPRINIGAEPASEVSIGFEWKEARQHVGEILDLPERIAAKKKLKLVVCIDEFQNLANWSDPGQVEKLLRAHWQRHKHVSYCLYGSKRHMMRELFNTARKPFYRFGDIIWLERIALEHWVPFLQERFRSTGRTITAELASSLARTMGCHPWYVQQLAHFSWAASGRKVRAEDLRGALDLLIATNQPLYQRECEIMSYTQTNLVKAILSGETQLTAQRVMHDYQLGTPRNVQKARMALEGNDVIDRTKDGYELLDPGFALWFAREFLGRAIAPA
ncbi:MAG: ATP-binding protein [Flavobacteriales bacterium]|nr:ATP-binding protein [Flavobacteriales bacterium]MCB9193136.1 ATP-binding protein [Flavobacteriales bacterium]